MDTSPNSVMILVCHYKPTFSPEVLILGGHCSVQPQLVLYKMISALLLLMILLLSDFIACPWLDICFYPEWGLLCIDFLITTSRLLPIFNCIKPTYYKIYHINYVKYVGQWC